MKKLLFRNFLKDVLKLFFLIGLSLSVIIWIIQAVNYLKFITDDGHNLQVYITYTLLNFPKIIHRITPFIFLIALHLQITNYEEKNELLIFWTYGITKISFINVTIFFTFGMMLIQIILGSYISPTAQGKARGYIKNSKMDFFPSLIKEGKFIDTVSGLTIFIDSKNSNGTYESIYIKEEIINAKNETDNKLNSEIIFAKSGFLTEDVGKRKFVLLNGSFIKNKNGEISSFKFDQIDFDLSKYTSKTVTHAKVQEIKSTRLIKCILFLKNNSNDFYKEGVFTCGKNAIKEINQEFLKRFYQPFYMPLIALISCLIIFVSKENSNYKIIKSLLFILSFIIIITSEIFLRYSASNDQGLIIFIFFPIVLFLILYSTLIIKFSFKIK